MIVLQVNNHFIFLIFVKLSMSKCSINSITIIYRNCLYSEISFMLHSLPLYETLCPWIPYQLHLLLPSLLPIAPSCLVRLSILPQFVNMPHGRSSELQCLPARKFSGQPHVSIHRINSQLIQYVQPVSPKVLESPSSPYQHTEPFIYSSCWYDH